MTEANQRQRALGWCLGVAAAFLLIMSVNSRQWVVVDDETHVGLWAEELCNGGHCRKLDGAERETAPKAGWLGTPTLLLGALTVGGLALQLFGVRLRLSPYTGAGAIVLATIVAFGKDGGIPGPAYTTFVIACLAAMIASTLLPDPLPHSIPPRPEPPPDGGSAMQPPEA